MTPIPLTKKEQFRRITPNASTVKVVYFSGVAKCVNGKDVGHIILHHRPTNVI